MESIRNSPMGSHGDDASAESVTADTDTAAGGPCGFPAQQQPQQQWGPNRGGTGAEAAEPTPHTMTTPTSPSPFPGINAKQPHQQHQQRQQQQQQRQKQKQQLADEMVIADAAAMSSSPTTTITATPITPPAIATTTPSPRLPSKPRHVTVETRKLHAAVASGNVAAVEAYIQQHAGNSKPSDVFGAEAPTVALSGLGAMLASSGLGSGATTGSSFEVRDRRGRTPLLTACVYAHAGLVRALLRVGANANAFDDAGYSALHRCAQSCDVASARALLEPRGAGSTCADVDALTRRGDYRPLHLACLAGSAEMVGLLARRSVEVSASDRWGCTPLHRACLEGHLGAAKAILDAGSVVDARDKWKCTPLHRACSAGHAAIVELLLQWGATSSAKDDLMERPGQSFESDVSSERRETICALLEKSEQSRKFSGGGGGGGGGGGKGRAEGSLPASASTVWSRPQSSEASSARSPIKRSPNRYVPPAARAAVKRAEALAAGAKDGEGSTSAAAAPAASTARAATATPTVPATAATATLTTAITSATAAVAADTPRVVQPWRRRSHARTGLTGESGPDVDASGRAVENTCMRNPAGNACVGKPVESSCLGRSKGNTSVTRSMEISCGVAGGGVGAILRAGRRNAAEAPPEEEMGLVGASSAGVRAAACCSPTPGTEEPDGGFDGFGDLHPDVFGVGDDWGMLQFDGSSQQPHSLGAGGAD